MTLYPTSFQSYNLTLLTTPVRISDKDVPAKLCYGNLREWGKCINPESMTFSLGRRRRLGGSTMPVEPIESALVRGSTSLAELSARFDAPFTMLSGVPAGAVEGDKRGSRGTFPFGCSNGSLLEFGFGANDCLTRAEALSSVIGFCQSIFSAVMLVGGVDFESGIKGRSECHLEHLL